MGYYTRYTLTQEVEPIGDEDFAKIISGNDWMKYCMEPDGRCSGEKTKWYEHETDMKDISTAHPETVFKLHGEGEEAGDVWEKFFKGGKKVFESKLNPEIPQPDLDKL